MKKILLIFSCLLCSYFLFGCSKQSIQINHKSPVTTFNNITDTKQKPKGVVKNSSGIIIYKDVSSSGGTGAKTIHFGPKDIDFDLPVRMK